MPAHPDSALNLLEDSILPSTLSGKARANWCLLITQARDKNWVEHTSDSLIRIACAYYENHPDPERLPMAYFYMGRVTYDLGHTHQAQEYFLKALEAGESSRDIPLKALINNQLGELYTRQHVYHSAIPYLEQAFELYKQTNDIEGMSFAKRDIGRIYHQLDSIDASFDAYQEALEYVHPNSRQSVLSELGDIYALKKKFKQALACLHESLQLVESTEEPTTLYLTLGDVFRQMGENDSARYYLYKCIDSRNPDTRAGSYYHLYHLSLDEQDWAAYARMQQKYEELSDSILHHMETDQILAANELYHYKQAESYKLKNTTNERNAFLLTLILLLVLVGLVGLYFYFRKWKKQKELQYKLQADLLHKNERIIADLKTKQADASKTPEQKNAIREEMERLEAENKQVLQENKTMRLSLIASFKASSLYENLTLIQDKQKIWGETDRLILRKWVDETHPYFNREMEKRCPTLSDEMKTIACLIWLGYSSKSIKTLYQVTSKTVSEWKRELHLRLTRTNDTAKGVDELVRSF